MITISTEANEQGTAFITFDFTDENGDAKTPVSLKWTLTDSSGTVINSREQVAVVALASSVTITLSGNDLQILSTESAKRAVYRWIIVEATYNSTLGNGLPATEEGRFLLNNLHYISGT